tara:strand:+ start:66 stop:587 length:522 start_codon:yes stop_codon:yes gene_type:complete
MAIYYGDGSNSGAGRIVQAVSSTNNNHYTFAIDSQGSVLTSGSFQASITPNSSSNKILVMMSFSISAPSDLEGAYQLIREVGGVATTVAKGSGSGARKAVTGAGELRVSSRLSTFNTSHIDSPSTTSVTKYYLQFRHDSSSSRTFTFNYDTQNANSYSAFRTCSMINLLEIAS